MNSNKQSLMGIPILVKNLGVAVVYFIVAYLGYSLASENDYVNTILPPAGIALAGLLLFGIAVVPGILTGAFFYILIMLLFDKAADLNTALISSIFISIGGTLQVVVGYYLLKNVKNPFSKPINIFRFAFVALIIPSINSTVAATVFHIQKIDIVNSYNNIWFAWYIGNVASILLITPFICTCAKTYKQKLSTSKFIETIVLFLLIIIAGGLIFFNWIPDNEIFQKAYLTIPLLLWAAYRLDQREVVTAIGLTSIMGLLGTIKHSGPFSQESIDQSFISSQIYISIICITILALKAAITESRNSENELKIAHSELTLLAEERNKKLIVSQNDLGEYQKRIESIFQLLLRYTIMDFSKKAIISENGDEIDAISTGLNTLGEELEFYIASEKKYTEELKELNALLKDSEQQLKTIFDNAPDAVIILDSNGIIERWNPTAEQVFGWKAEEIIGKPLLEFLIPIQYHDAYTKGMEQFLMTRKPHLLNRAIEIDVLNRQGKTFPVSLNVSPTYIKGKYLFIAFARDITERKKAQETIRKSESFLNSVVENIPNMLFIKDADDLRFVRLNKAGEDLLGFGREDLMGKNDYDFFPKEEADFFIQKDKEVLNSGKLFEIPQESIHTKNKGVRILETKKIPLLDEQGKPQFLLGISNDITERIKLEKEIIRKSEELEALTRELSRSNIELEQFAYVASHDLQEPLRMVNSYVQLLSKRYKDKLDTDAKEFIAFAVDGSNRMRLLIQSLLEYSRINRVKPFEKINLQNLLTDVLHDLKARIKETQATINIEELPDGVIGDHVLLSQLFLNLISNSLKFIGKDNPVVILKGIKREGDFLFSVKDNGIGIQPEYAEKIFIIFQRLHTKDKYPGTGIGLAICKKIVERHGGKIWMESEIDKGTTFYFTIKENL